MVVVPFSPQERISNKIFETVNGKYVKMKSSILLYSVYIYIYIMFMIADVFVLIDIFLVN